MELKDRIKLIADENKLKQKELSVIMGISESYVSYILAGRKTNLSTAVAKLIEERLGYNAQWVLTGEGDKFPGLSDAHKHVISRIEQMTDLQQVLAIIAYIDSLDKAHSRFSKDTQRLT